MNKEINIAESTGKAEYKVSPTKIAPCMEQLYFEFEDKNHIFQIGIKTLLECIIFGINENQLPKLPYSWYDEICSRYDISPDELMGEEK